MLDGTDTPRNALLASLPESTYDRLRPDLEDVSLEKNDVLHEAHGAVTHAYFPHDAIVALRQCMRDGSSVAVAMVGCEGVVGTCMLLGADASPHLATVQHAGRSSRIAVPRLRDHATRIGPLAPMLLRYTQVLMGQIAQTAACHRMHSVDQQFCTWLAMSLDRRPGNVLIGTHEGIAKLLGVRREGITWAASRLQEAGAIECGRGRIEVLDRKTIEARACECYHAVKTEHERLLPRGVRAVAPAARRQA
jgi:hypothetical protein